MEIVLVIVGPTAVGKTALSVELAQLFGGEIISGDSLQIYKNLDIGTAKIKEEEMNNVPHHLIDVIEPTQRYSAADFQHSGRQLITEIANRGHLPIIAGGTGLYIQSLLYDYQLGATEEANPEIRKKYETLAETIGSQALWNQLKEKDPAAAEKIHWNNQRKVIRALEVLETTGHSITAPKEEPKQLYDYLMIGLVAEARKVYELGEVQASQGIGYKEFFPYFEGKETLEEATEQVKLHSRRYAKRQLTWFRNRLDAQWFDLISEPNQKSQIEQTIKKWLEAE